MLQAAQSQHSTKITINNCANPSTILAASILRKARHHVESIEICLPGQRLAGPCRIAVFGGHCLAIAASGACLLTALISDRQRQSGGSGRRIRNWAPRVLLRAAFDLEAPGEAADDRSRVNPGSRLSPSLIAPPGEQATARKDQTG
jgi:hypothetical protein